MIPKQIDQIEKPDIDRLIENEVRELRTIDYKMELPGNSDKDKKEFLADVSSFANAAGGDLVFGVREEEGVPKEVNGLTCDLDAEILRLENIIRDGLDPRIPGVKSQPVDGFQNGSVLVIRVPQSWNAPHMVKFKNSSRFHTRNSAGKYQMDSTEIRSAFLLSEAIPEKIKRFRDDRIGKIIAGETPVPMSSSRSMILHILPIGSFSRETTVDFEECRIGNIQLEPLAGGGWRFRFNMDGFFTFSGQSATDKSNSYCQLFRNGAIESAFSKVIREDSSGSFLKAAFFEEIIVKATVSYMKVLKKLGIEAPIVITLSFVNFKGVQLERDFMSETGEIYSLNKNVFLFSDILIEDYESAKNQNSAAKALRPIFDMVWNAFGLPCSTSFNDQEDWRPRY
jgi:hypothetical protein